MSYTTNQIQTITVNGDTVKVKAVYAKVPASTGDVYEYRYRLYIEQGESRVSFESAGDIIDFQDMVAKAMEIFE